MSGNNTSGNASSFKDLVEADKRSILENFLNAGFSTSKSKDVGSATSNESKRNESIAWTNATDYDAIFGEDIDDSDELFEDILRRAKEEFKKQQELKKKNPNHEIIKDIFKKPARPKKTRKRTKAVEQSLAIMNNFRNNLVDGVDHTATFPTSTTSNTDYNQFKSSIKTITQGNQPRKRAYPIWKSTETYTPVFSAITNPNWTNLHSNSAKTSIIKKTCTPVQSKLYTPGHINSWMDVTTNSNLTAATSCKTIRSDVAVRDSDSDEEGINTIDNNSIDNNSIFFSPKYRHLVNENSNVDRKTPSKNAMSPNTSIPMKSTTVRFKPSPPEYFLYGSDGNSSISSDTIFVEDNESNGPFESPKIYNESYQNKDESSVSLRNSPLPPKNEYSTCKQNIEYKEHYRVFSNNNFHNQTEKKVPNNSLKKPMFVEDFVRQLNYNINNNHNMELKYSMKVKYYK